MTSNRADVSLIVTSGTMSVEELDRRIGLQATTTKHVRSGRLVWEHGGSWSTVPARRQIADALALVAAHCDRLAELPAECHAQLSIGISLEPEEAPVNFALDPTQLITLARARVELAVSIYPG